MLRNIVSDGSSVIPAGFNHGLPFARAESANGGAVVSSIEFSGERKRVRGNEVLDAYLAGGKHVLNERWKSSSMSH
jgi:hypothetical protein